MTVTHDPRRDAERAHDRNEEYFHNVNRAAIDASQLALRTAVLINGGAAIAVLAFIGSLASDNKIPLNRLAATATSLDRFAWGVAAATLAMAFAYFTNYAAGAVARSREKRFDEPYLRENRRTGIWKSLKVAFQTISIALGLGSVLLFIYGMISVGAAITHLGAIQLP